jgi:hypothetical protein
MVLRISVAIALCAALLVPGCHERKRKTTTNTTVFTGAPVVLFANTAFVDFNPLSSDSEASNLVATLQSQGRAVDIFLATTAEGIAQALEGRAIFVLPEQEVSTLNGSLTADSRAAIASFVDAGGILIAFQRSANDLDTVNAIFNTTLAGAGVTGPTTIAAGATGTVFDGGSATLGTQSGANALTSASVTAAGGTAIYTETGGNVVVSIIPRGNGWIVMLGWDWFDALPTGTQDSGWLDVLNRACQLP